MTAHSSLKEKWALVVDKLTAQFAEGDPLNLDSIIYLIGIQELGQGHRKFKNIRRWFIKICW